ncbi:MAG: hypothetical protein CM1200mP29_10720 [Verrucomicrobiota bacterium]|nr:MAG: hypothetical protein CM1200mP29_10720 [Verrucomicrobiota bacterium]
MAALVLSLPMLIANLANSGARHADLRGAHSPRVSRPAHAVLRAVVANVCLVAGTVGMILCVLCSAPRCSPLWRDAGVGSVLVVVAWLQWRFLVRVYARAQIALKETFEANELDQADAKIGELPAGLLEAAHLDSVAWPRGAQRSIIELANWSFAKKTGEHCGH